MWSHLDISMMKNMYAATWNTSQEVRVRFRLRWTFGRRNHCGDIREGLEEYEYEEDDILEEQVKKRIRQKGSVTKENFQKYYGYFARKDLIAAKILDLLRKYMED